MGTALGYLGLYILLVEFFGFQPILAAILGYILNISFLSPMLQMGFSIDLGYLKTSFEFFIVNGAGYLLNAAGIFLCQYPTVELFSSPALPCCSCFTQLYF